ncbi:hypothetical protein TNCV_4568841 [Trichonephila clavipes]|nr:hypothetical protein TNCV_4568841 [Trichonephila clavipes]
MLGDGEVSKLRCQLRYCPRPLTEAQNYEVVDSPSVASKNDVNQTIIENNMQILFSILYLSVLVGFFLVLFLIDSTTSSVSLKGISRGALPSRVSAKTRSKHLFLVLEKFLSKTLRLP